jgi:hypothetical protein
MNPPSQDNASFLNRHPWIYVVLAFVLLISAWSALITLAVKNSPETIEVIQNR